MADTEPQQRLPSALRVSHQPVMVAGLTGTEFLMTVTAGFGAFFVLAALASLFLAFHVSILAGSLSGAGAGMLLRGAIVNAKRQKPEGYPVQLVHRFRHRVEPIRELVSEGGRWEPMRHGR